MVVKIKGRKELHLFSEEKILLQTKAIINKKTQKLSKFIFPLFGIAGFILISIAIFILTESISSIILIISLMITILASMFIFSFFFYLINEYNNSRTVYYFTSQRLIKWIEKKILYQKKKEIKYGDISHLIDWGMAIEVVPKNKNGQLYYKGDETEFFHKFRGLKSIKILLHGSKGKKINMEIINTLVQGIPLKKHPNLEFLYFQESIIKEKDINWK